MTRSPIMVAACLLSLGLGACGARTGLEPGMRETENAGEGGAPQQIQLLCTTDANDPRVAGIRPDEVATLDGAQFVSGPVRSYRWTLKEEDCDAVVPHTEYVLNGVQSQVIHFQPSRPATYTFTLEATGTDGAHAACELKVPVKGIGLRVEACWDTSTSTDLDLYLHTPFDTSPWFAAGAIDVNSGIRGNTCSGTNCAAVPRGFEAPNWGFPDSPLDNCRTPPFQEFLAKNRCPNPRAAEDNNQSIATGTSERIQLDNPGEGRRFRVMVQNFNNRPAHPHVFVYCGGQRVSAFEPPASAGALTGPNSTFGAMWRPTDVITHVDAQGNIACAADAITPAAHIVTYDDPSF